MTDTRTLDDKFKATFGYITDHALDAKKHDVRAKLAAIKQDIGNLPGTTPDATKKFNADAIDRLKQLVEDVALNLKSEKDAYKICVDVEKRADKVAKAVRAIAESEKQLPLLQKLIATGSDTELAKLDDMVKKIGDKAKSAKEQGFMIAAIRARFDIDELSGELTSGALPRFYKVLGMVPPEHARLNDKLKRIHREKKDDTSTAAAGQMTINAGLAKDDNTTGKFNDSEGKRLKLKNFDQTTLHEIGHTVDEAYEFMKSKRSDTAFGGWKESSLDEVAGLVADELKKSLGKEAPSDTQLAWIAKNALIGTGKKGIEEMFNGEQIKREQLSGWKTMKAQDWLAEKAIKAADDAVEVFLRTAKDPTDMNEVNPWVQRTDPEKLKALSDYKAGTPEGEIVRKLIGAMISFQKIPKRAAGILKEQMTKQMTELQELDTKVPTKTAFDKLKSDPWIAQAKMMGDKLWEKSQEEIESTRIGDKIYQFNQSVWWKYDLKARDSRVSDYQFRSPLEWFAEVYAVFKLGKLNTSHPCYKLINGIKTKQV